MSQAGAFVRHQVIGRWWASIPKERWPDPVAVEEVTKKYWTNKYGDRRQEIVFIGLKDQINEDNIRNALDACLVNEYLSSPEVFQKLEDPLPKWFSKKLNKLSHCRYYHVSRITK